MKKIYARLWLRFHGYCPHGTYRGVYRDCEGCHWDGVRRSDKESRKRQAKNDIARRLSKL